jgi:carboxylesterase type B
VISRCADANALECLRAVNSTLLQEINENVILASFFGTTTFGPVVDGSFIAQSPTDALEQGLVNGVRLHFTTGLGDHLTILRFVGYFAIRDERTRGHHICQPKRGV